MAREDIRSTWYAGDLRCWAPEYSGRDLPSDSSTQSVVVGLLDCQAEPAAPEYDGETPNMTGRYQGKYSVCCINQAGRHMELWYSASNGGRHVYHYWADQVDAGGVFEIRELGDPTVFQDLMLIPTGKRSAPVGILTIEADDRFHIDWNDAEGTGGTYRRFSKRATLSDRAAARMRPWGIEDETVAGWLANEHAPVRQEDLTQLLDHFTSHEFTAAIQRIMGLEVDNGNLNTGEVAENIALLIEQLERRLGLDKDPHTDSTIFAPSDRDRLSALIWPELVSKTIKLQTPAGGLEHRSIYEWLQRVLYYNKHYSAGTGHARISVLTQWLGIPFPHEAKYEIFGSFVVFGLDAALPFSKALERFVPKAKALVGKALSKVIDKITKFRWDWGNSIDKKKIEKIIFDKVGKKIEKLLTAHAGGKVLLGVMTVRAPNGGWEHPFEVVATVGCAGLGSGKNGTEPFNCSGTATAGYDWKPEAFEGHFFVVGPEQSAELFGDAKPSQMNWLLHGHGAAGQLRLVWDHLETKTSSMDLAWGFGVIGDIDDSVVDPVPVTPVFEYTSELHRENDVHFVLGSATMRPVTRQLLRIFAASELAMLRDPMCSLAVEGYADRLGGRHFNKVLSESRAANVRQALVDALGSDLRAKVTTHGNGEDVIAALGEAFGFPDDKPSEQWRRCFVVLDGVVAAVMGTNDWKTKK